MDTAHGLRSALGSLNSDGASVSGFLSIAGGERKTCESRKTNRRKVMPTRARKGFGNAMNQKTVYHTASCGLVINLISPAREKASRIIAVSSWQTSYVIPRTFFSPIRVSIARLKINTRSNCVTCFHPKGTWALYFQRQVPDHDRLPNAL